MRKKTLLNLKSEYYVIYIYRERERETETETERQRHRERERIKNKTIRKAMKVSRGWESNDLVVEIISFSNNQCGL